MQETNKIEDEEEIDIVRKALEFNVRATKLKSHLQLKLQKPGLSTNHVRYVMQKMKGQDKDKEDLSVFLEAIVKAPSDSLNLVSFALGGHFFLLTPGSSLKRTIIYL